MTDFKSTTGAIADEISLTAKRIATRAWLKQNGRDLPQDAEECLTLIKQLTTAIQRLYGVRSASEQPCSEDQ